jgi:hypothetical protein
MLKGIEQVWFCHSDKAGWKHHLTKPSLFKQLQQEYLQQTEINFEEITNSQETAQLMLHDYIKKKKHDYENKKF